MNRYSIKELEIFQGKAHKHPAKRRFAFFAPTNKHLCYYYA